MPKMRGPHVSDPVIINALPLLRQLSTVSCMRRVFHAMTRFVSNVNEPDMAIIFVATASSLWRHLAHVDDAWLARFGRGA
ncbi:hypothetical protein [Cupriavidus numazuensis]|uniref:hypothetical protein n=1 Tax=Cupriavidus numazuensis TaxID=221992 RepID=UPI001FD1E9C2|nr:hypothetical protein [Cupriavidus numazuensis]